MNFKNSWLDMEQFRRRCNEDPFMFEIKQKHKRKCKLKHRMSSLPLWKEFPGFDGNGLGPVFGPTVASTFMPSDVLIKLFDKSTGFMSEENKASWYQRIAINITSKLNDVLRDIENRKLFNEVIGLAFPIISRNGVMLAAIFKEISMRGGFTGGNSNDYEFQLRFGEELLSWAIRHPSAAKAFSMSIDANGRLVINRKPLSKV